MVRPPITGPVKLTRPISLVVGGYFILMVLELSDYISQDTGTRCMAAWQCMFRSMTESP